MRGKKKFQLLFNTALQNPGNEASFIMAVLDDLDVVALEQTLDQLWPGFESTASMLGATLTSEVVVSYDASNIAQSYACRFSVKWNNSKEKIQGYA